MPDLELTTRRPMGAPPPRLARWTSRRIFLACLIAAGVILAGMIALGTANVRSMPIERSLTLSVPGLPAGNPPITMALLSDIHLGLSGMTPEHFEAIVDRVNASRPDLILLAGDFMTGHGSAGALERAEQLTAPLARLRASQGVIAVLGNHDFWTAADAVRVALSKAGITVLDNTAIRRGPLAIVGISDRFSGRDDIAASLTDAQRVGGVPIVLTHSPDITPELPADLPLVMAGHTHCGQIVLPVFGPLANHSPLLNWRRIYDPRYRCGIVQDGTRTTVVTAGVGAGTVPIRIGAMPDWWTITLKP